VIKEWTQLPQSDKDKLQAMSPAQLLDMYKKASTDVTAVKVERKQVEAEVNLMHDISSSKDERVIRDVCEQMGICTEDLLAVVSSPPCETFSHADASNIGLFPNDNYYRDHKDPDKPPRSWESCKDQAALDIRQKAIEHDKMVRNIIRSYTKDREQGWNYDLAMANPLGSLR
jgi:hypothetical protein